MKKSLFTLAIFLSSSIIVIAQSKNEKSIRLAMNEQLAAWNAGDINRFMGTYWKDDSMMFIGKSGVTYGWQKTLENYKRGYPDTAAMGKLDFTILKVRRLSPEYYFVVGKWNLLRSIGNIGGAYTLLFRRIDGRWLIVSDHSS